MTKGEKLMRFVYLTNQIDEGLARASKRALDRDIPTLVFHAIAEHQQLALEYVREDVKEVQARVIKVKVKELKEKYRND